MHTFIGKDPSGIKRVYGEDENADVAESACREEIIKYVRRRPDTGPVSAWTVERDDA